MKKIILLLTALLMTAGAIQSQVKIGQNGNPEKGAILDLNGTVKGGLLLPNVNITDLGKIPTTFSDASVAGLDNAPALAGLIVWNTHSGSEGVYMWDGANWQLLTEDSGPTTDCSGAPSITSISGFSGTYNLNAVFDVTCNATASGVTLYTWTAPAGLTVVSGNGTKTVRLKGTTAGTYNGTTLSCTVANACGSAASTAASNVTVNNCSAAPATPGAITLGATTVNLNGTFTASITAVSGATSYVWALPTGLTGTSTTNSITITGATAGTYAVGTIKVAARNDCGTSATSNSAAAVTVRTCAAAPAQPGTMTLSATTVAFGKTFTASVPSGSGVTYAWSLPSGLTGNSTTNTITITATAAGTYAAASISVRAQNPCGSSPARSSTLAVRVGQEMYVTATYRIDERKNAKCQNGFTLYSYQSAPSSLIADSRDAGLWVGVNRWWWFQGITWTNPQASDMQGPLCCQNVAEGRYLCVRQ